MPCYSQRTLAAVAAILLLSACAGNMAKGTAEPTANNDDYYEVEREGRLYVFDDAGTFREFLEVGETSFRKVRIGAGPKGETVVFGLSAADKKKSSGIASIDMFDGRLAGAADFYAELHRHGRIYVFDRWEDLQAVKRTGHPALMYTVIGGGPKGETIVCVLNEHNKKHKPLALIARFNALHG